jgi:heat shock protein HslJ
MFHKALAIIMIVVIFLFACSSGKQASRTKKNNAVLSGFQADSISYFDDRYSVTRVIGQKELEGRWEVETMLRKPDSVPEKLSGVTLSFADSSFAGNAPCNSIAGDFVLDGKNIGFGNIIGTKMACPKMDQETAFIGLLQKNIKSAVIDGERLLLRDRMGNTVFECKKR